MMALRRNDGQQEQNPSWHILLCQSGCFTNDRTHRNLWKPVGMLCCSLRTGFHPVVLQSLFCLSLAFSPVFTAVFSTHCFHLQQEIFAAVRPRAARDSSEELCPLQRSEVLTYPNNGNSQNIFPLPFLHQIPNKFPGFLG